MASDPETPGRVRPLPPVIGVTAPARRSGKGEVADYLIAEYGYRRVKFSDPIIMMFGALAQAARVDPDAIWRAVDGDLKEVPLEALGGLSYRSFAETIGNDWGREIAVPSGELWASIAERRIKTHRLYGARVVVDDLRYPNESELVRRHGGVVLSVTRPLSAGGLAPKWQSEGRLSLKDIDLVITNDGTIEELHEKVREALGIQ